MSANWNIDQGVGGDAPTGVALARTELPMLRLDELMAVAAIVGPTFVDVEASKDTIVSSGSERDPHAAGTR